MNIRICSLTGILALITVTLAAQQPAATRLDSLLHTHSTRAFNGVVLIAKNGKTQYTSSIGEANREKKQLLNSNSPFIIMSVTKQMTAVHPEANMLTLIWVIPC